MSGSCGSNVRNVRTKGVLTPNISIRTCEEKEESLKGGWRSGMEQRKGMLKKNMGIAYFFFTSATGRLFINISKKFLCEWPLHFIDDE